MHKNNSSKSENRETREAKTEKHAKGKNERIESVMCSERGSEEGLQSLVFFVYLYILVSCLPTLIRECNVSK